MDFELLCYLYLAKDKGKLMHNLYWSVYLAFQEAGIVIPFPQRDIHIKNEDDLVADKVLTHEQL